MPVITGTEDSDTRIGSVTDDTIYGGVGSHDFPFDTGNDTLSGGDGNDKIYGYRGNDHLYGENDNDLLGGGPGNDTLEGGPGDDVLYSGFGDDTLLGGTGVDTVSYDALPLYDENGEIDHYEVEQFSNNGIAASLAITVAQNTGGSGVDTLVDIENLIGSRYDDFLVGNANANVLDGSGGNDRLNGGFGIDTLIGGSGNDTYVIADFTEPVVVPTVITPPVNLGTYDQIQDASGIDTVELSVASGSKVSLYVLPDNVENGILTGSATRISGNALSNELTGNTGNDTLIGGFGLDTAIYANNRSSYTVTTAGATVTVSGPQGTDTLTSMEILKFADGTMALTNNSNDFNGDGRSDILFSSNVNSIRGAQYEWQLNDRAISGQGGIDLYDRSFSEQVTGDFDGDGKSDLLLRNPTTGGVWAWLLDGTTIKSQGAVDVADPGFHILGTGDFNGDGRDDVLYRNNAGFLYLWQMNGLSDTSLPIGALDPAWQVAGVGDLDGDGRADIFLHNVSNTSANGAYRAWIMHGSSVYFNLGIERPDPSWHTLGVGDFDGDGKADIAIRNQSSTGDNGAVWVYQLDLKNLQVFEGGGASYVFSIEAQGAAGIVKASDFDTVGVGDYNGDGKSDFLFRNAAGYFYSWDMNGTHIGSEGPLPWASPDQHVVTQHWQLL